MSHLSVCATSISSPPAIPHIFLHEERQWLEIFHQSLTRNLEDGSTSLEYAGSLGALIHHFAVARMTATLIEKQQA